MLQYDPGLGRFIPGTLPANGSKISILYARLSQEDAQAGDSESITNQLDFLLRYALDCRLPNPRFFYDDGYSGTNFDRPDFNEAMEIVEAGRAANFVVKDHSRFGRDRLKVGFLMERLTEDFGVRYIAVTDNIDSNKGFDDMVAFRELFNEFYPRDTSKKIRAVFTNKGNNGERLCTQVLYGYTGDKHTWEIDPVAAEVVREIFALAVSGLGPMQIAKRLTAEGHLTPTAYRLSQGKKTHNPPPADPCKWDSSTIVNILEHLEYTGCTVNFKGYKKSYKSKKRIVNPPEKWKIFPNTHPAIIDRETWERVQELRQHRRRPTKTGRQGLFSGLIYCFDCGAKLHFATCKAFDRTQDNYRCSNYKSNTGSCSAHFIREVTLKSLVLEQLREVVSYARDHEDEFLQAVTDKSAAQQKQETAQKRKDLAQAQRRMAELDTLFQRIYEDNVAGKLTDERFNKLSSGYEAEQRNLVTRSAALQAELYEAQDKAAGVEQFMALVRKYTEIQELTPTIVNEFIRRIEIHAPDKSSGHRVQQVDIEYNFIGQPPTVIFVPQAKIA